MGSNPTYLGVEKASTLTSSCLKYLVALSVYRGNFQLQTCLGASFADSHDGFGSSWSQLVLHGTSKIGTQLIVCVMLIDDLRNPHRGWISILANGLSYIASGIRALKRGAEAARPVWQFLYFSNV